MVALPSRQPVLVPECFGERLFLAGILRRAAYDIALYKGSPRLDKRRLWKDAYDWLMSDADDHFCSFMSICIILDQDPQKIRRKTLALRREDVKKIELVVS